MMPELFTQALPSIVQVWWPPPQWLVLLVASIVTVGLISYGLWLAKQPWDEIEAIEREMAEEARKQKRND